MTQQKRRCETYTFHSLFGILCFLLVIGITPTHTQDDSYVHFRDFENVLIKLVISLAKNGQYNDARRELKKLENYESHVSSIITQIYDANPKNTERSVEMLYSINCDAYVLGAVALFNAIKSNGHLTKPETLMFANQVEQPDCIESPKINDTIAQIQPHIDTILTEWGADIRLGKFDNIYSYIELSDEQYNSLRHRVPVLIQKAMRGDLTSFNATLAFVKGLPFLRFIAPGYMALIRELKAIRKGHSEEMLMLSYRLYETMTTRMDIIKNNTDLEELYFNVKAEVPLVLQNIFWKETCTIRSLFWKEFLHAAREPRDGGNGVVFTWITGYKVTAAEWILIPEVVEERMYFQVKNKVLSGDEEDYFLCESPISKSVVTCDPETEKKELYTWLVMPTIWHEDNAFKIKNTNKSPKSGGGGGMPGLTLFAETQADIEATSFLQATKEYDLGGKRREVMDSFEEDSSHWHIDCY